MTGVKVLTENFWLKVCKCYRLSYWG